MTEMLEGGRDIWGGGKDASKRGGKPSFEFQKISAARMMGSFLGKGSWHVNGE